MKRVPVRTPSPYESGTWGTPQQPCPSERTLAAFLDGELDARQAHQVEDHLDRCDACASDHARLEGLSGCVKAWDAALRRELEPPPRLAARILREVSPEGSALRQESVRATRRFWAAAASVVLAVGAAGALGARAAQEARGHGAASRWSPPGLEIASATVAPLDPRPSIAPRPLTIPGAAITVPSEGAETPLPAVLFEPESLAALATWLPALEVQRRIGEPVCVYEGKPLPTWALPAYERMRRWSDWVADRERLVREPPTRDPALAGRPLSDLLPLAGADGASLLAALRSGTGVIEPASPGRGGIVLRALVATTQPVQPPAANPRPAQPSTQQPSTQTDATTVLSLAEAVRAGRVTILRDDRADASELTLEVDSRDAAVLVPAGELIAGGAGDRVVAQGAWLAASPEAYTLRLGCRPVVRHPLRAATPPTVVGCVAGPEVRALLARGEAADAVLDLVEAQLVAAEILPPDGPARASAARASLLALYRVPDGAPSVERRAAQLVTALGDDARGFVASDPSGRFQGIESVDLPPAAARAFLVRLVEGYLLEARSRSAADAPRLGIHAETVLATLSDRPVRLSLRRGAFVGTLSGTEPRTGLVLEGPSPDGVRAVHLSGLVPSYDAR